ncbi:hypothetical protein GGF32_004892 [Allomyces javanicus]|nr:hypothetical protein GGF32_004892 [Allomyces javanicus]
MSVFESRPPPIAARLMFLRKPAVPRLTQRLRDEIELKSGARIFPYFEGHCEPALSDHARDFFMASRRKHDSATDMDSSPPALDDPDFTLLVMGTPHATDLALDLAADVLDAAQESLGAMDLYQRGPCVDVMEHVVQVEKLLVAGSEIGATSVLTDYIMMNAAILDQIQRRHRVMALCDERCGTLKLFGPAETANDIWRAEQDLLFRFGESGRTLVHVLLVRPQLHGHKEVVDALGKFRTHIATVVLGSVLDYVSVKMGPHQTKMGMLLRSNLFLHSLDLPRRAPKPCTHVKNAKKELGMLSQLIKDLINGVDDAKMARANYEATRTRLSGRMDRTTTLSPVPDRVRGGVPVLLKSTIGFMDNDVPGEDERHELEFLSQQTVSHRVPARTLVAPAAADAVDGEKTRAEDDFAAEDDDSRAKDEADAVALHDMGRISRENAPESRPTTPDRTERGKVVTAGGKHVSFAKDASFETTAARCSMVGTTGLSYDDVSGMSADHIRLLEVFATTDSPCADDVGDIRDVDSDCDDSDTDSVSDSGSESSEEMAGPRARPNLEKLLLDGVVRLDDEFSDDEFSNDEFSDDESDFDSGDSVVLVDGLLAHDIAHKGAITDKDAAATHDGPSASAHWGAGFASQLVTDVQDRRAARFDLFCAASPHADKVRRVQDLTAALFDGQGAGEDEGEEDAVATWLNDVNDGEELSWV